MVALSAVVQVASVAIWEWHVSNLDSRLGTGTHVRRVSNTIEAGNSHGLRREEEEGEGGREEEEEGGGGGAGRRRRRKKLTDIRSMH